MSKSGEDPERLSRSLRQTVEVDDRFCVDVLYVAYRLEQLGHITFKRVSNSAMSADHAMYDGITKTLHIPERTFHALDRPGNASRVERRRQRFTLAHEFFHVLDDRPGRRYRGTSDAIARKLDSRIRVDEIYANRFASALLVPAHLIDRSQADETLSELFDVNPVVIRIRRKGLDDSDRRQTGEARKLPDSIIDYLRAAERKGFKSKSLKAEMERRRRAALALGFLGDPCDECEEFTVRQSADGTRCETCGKFVQQGEN